MSSVHYIKQSLSLRKPQEEALLCLEKIAHALPLKKILGEPQDVKVALEAIKASIPEATEFASFEDRTFPSICFSLATAVGKTRLMGAAIAYLHSVKKINNFFVLAPNLTIYDKLTRDFTEGTPKFVFKGLGSIFTQNPRIITGDNYREKTMGAITQIAPMVPNLLYGECNIFIFNISKINQDTSSTKGVPKVRGKNEYLGVPFFEYLTTLPDLVLLMDESHRYRGAAGLKALSELSPVLGIELTATPHVGIKKTRFENIAYDYPLHKAMEDGFVKIPAVAARSNLDPNTSDDQIQEMKLLDGISLHENTKGELALYASRNPGKKYIKPIVLIIAKNIEHAKEIDKTINSDGFFNGNYKGKTLTVHSDAGDSKVEKDEIVKDLLSVEDPENNKEIIIHVDMLKEGWDVTNLFTIIPMRTFDSITLVEQCLGRGLRLPYGQRTGVLSVDKLNIVAHDNFSKIIQAAKDKRYEFQRTEITDDLAKKPKIIAEIRDKSEVATGSHSDNSLISESSPKPTYTLSDTENHVLINIKKVVSEVTKSLHGSDELNKPEIRTLLEKKVNEVVLAQQTIEGVVQTVDIAKLIDIAVEMKIQFNIDVPRITMTPDNRGQTIFHPFTVDLTGFNHTPLDVDLLSVRLDTQESEMIKVLQTSTEDSLEKIILISLTLIDAARYDENQDLCADLCRQVADHVLSRNTNDEKIARSILTNRGPLYAQMIFEQMLRHSTKTDPTFQLKVTEGSMEWSKPSIGYYAGQKPLFIHQPAPKGEDIKSQYYHGFKKCIYEFQRFQSDQERQIAEICESDPTVVKWTKPFPSQFNVFYMINDFDEKRYDPDFVIETSDIKLMLEVKDSSEVESTTVKNKTAAAKLWCEEASRFAQKKQAKEWHYVLVPHDRFDATWNIKGLVSTFKK